MKFKYRKKIASLMLCLIMVINLVPIVNGVGDIIITPLPQKASAAVVMPTGELVFKVDGANYSDNSVIDMSQDHIEIGLGHSSGSLPSGVVVEFFSYNASVIEMDAALSSTKDTMYFNAVGPGYAEIVAIVTYDEMEYRIDCLLHVPLEFEEFQTSSDGYGLVKTFVYGGESFGLQLKGNEAIDMNTYLPKLKYVTYNAGYSDSFIIPGTAPTTILPSLKWESSDETIVMVDQNGIIKAKGAGYAEITITTISDASHIDTLTFPVVVAPTGKLTGTVGTLTSNVSFTATSDDFSFETNALDASNLVWVVHPGTSTALPINPETSNLMDMYVSEVSGTVSFSNVKAGKYYITARPSTVYSEENSAIKKLEIEVTVPLFFDHNNITMNVGDLYNIYENSNMPLTSWFSYSSPDVLIASVNQEGLIKAESEGNTTIRANAKSPNPNMVNHDVTVKVLDGLGLNTTAATIYTGAKLQLVMSSSSENAATWVSSNPLVATVDENGVVTGVAVGDSLITVSQKINGITKRLTCQIKVKQTVTSITLTPSSHELAVGDNLTINASILPKLNSVSLHFVSSDNSVVEILDSGSLSTIVRGVIGGVAVISAINQDNVVVGSCLITVYQPIESITLSETSVTVPLSSGSFQIFTTITPITAKNQPIIWRSTNERILTVDQNGRVTVLQSGSAAVIVTSAYDASIQAICNVKVSKAVTGIELDTKIKDMYVGESHRLTYVVSPSDSSNATVTWISGNPSVASVDTSGLVTARAVGTTTIILKTTDGGYLTTCLIRVSQTATAVKLDVTSLTLNKGDYYYFETQLTPADATETTLSWETSDSKVAMVSKTGKLVAKGAGTCFVLVKTKSGSTGYCTVTVLEAATGIEISNSQALIMVGEKLELTATVFPANKDNQDVIWLSSNEKVVTVDEDGEIKGISGGIAVITCEAEDGGFVDYCIVTVEERITEITLNKTYYKLGLGKTFRLIADINGKNATNKELKWSSDNSSIVSVDKYGRIKGKKLGTAVITCIATDGSGAEASCTVRVSRLVTSINLDVTYLTLVQGKSYALRTTVSPGNATYKVPLFSVDNKEIAIVNKKGVITGLTPGDAIVTVKANDSGEEQEICFVRVIAPIATTGVSVSESEVVMSPGETKTVAISLVPNNTTDTVSWSSDNNMVATVDAKSGRISAKGIGTANITIMSESGRRGTIKVFVVGISRTEVELEQYTNMEIGLQVDGGANGLNVRWDTDNQRIASIVNGTVTGKQLGTTTVYAIVNGRRLACRITVVKIR